MMLIERKTMNILFYLGIILPTIITVILFVLFIICWYRITVRRDVLTKKHDPHGKMREMGMSRVPPPPPVFARPEFRRLAVIDRGQDNGAYHVSRSPSTEQESGARPGLYHAPHDSGLSELSEFQCKDRPDSQASQGSTDSEDSGFRSSRSGQYHPSTNNNNQQDIPLLKPIKSNKNGGETVLLSPSDNIPMSHWQTQTCSRTLNSSGRKRDSTVRNMNLLSSNFQETSLNCSVKHPNSSSRNLNPGRTMGKYPSESEQSTAKLNLGDISDISTHVSWMYLQNLAASSCTTHPPVTNAQIHGITQPPVTTKQLHCSSTNMRGACVEPNRDLLGYSVV